MKTIIKTIMLGGILLPVFTTITVAQDSTQIDRPNKGRGGATKFLLAGKAAMSWTNMITQTPVPGSPEVTTKSHTFFPDAFMLMPLVKVDDRLFLDAQVEVDVYNTRH